MINHWQLKILTSLFLLPQLFMNFFPDFSHFCLLFFLKKKSYIFPVPPEKQSKLLRIFRIFQSHNILIWSRIRAQTSLLFPITSENFINRLFCSRHIAIPSLIFFVLTSVTDHVWEEIVCIWFHHFWTTGDFIDGKMTPLLLQTMVKSMSNSTNMCNGWWGVMSISEAHASRRKPNGWCLWHPTSHHFSP